MARITTHPGEVLHEEFMVPLGLSANKLGEMLGVPANRISEIIRGRRGVTADTALRLAKCFGTTPEFWMNLQTAHDVSKTAMEHGKEIKTSVKPAAA
jgi:addiction module HigA family antidote